MPRLLLPLAGTAAAVGECVRGLNSELAKEAAVVLTGDGHILVTSDVADVLHFLEAGMDRGNGLAAER